jgi:hypothetical protein
VTELGRNRLAGTHNVLEFLRELGVNDLRYLAMSCDRSASAESLEASRVVVFMTVSLLIVALKLAVPF